MSAIYGSIVLLFSSALCSSAGVGGGSLNVPIFISIWGFDYDTAVALSLCTLMGNYLFQVLVNLDKRHPSSPTKTLIYWDAVLIMLPVEIGGANLGVILGSAFPDTIIYSLALVVLVFAVYFSTKKGMSLYEKENSSHEYTNGLKLNAALLGATFDPRNASYKNHGSFSGNDSMISELGLSVGASAANTPLLLQDKQVPLDEKKAKVEVSLSSIIPHYLCCYYFTPNASTSKTSAHYPSKCDDQDENDDEADQSGEFDESYCNNRQGAAAANNSISPSKFSSPSLIPLPPVRVPWLIISVVGAVWVLYVICYVVQQQFSKCSVVYFVLLFLMYPVLFAEVMWGVQYLAKQQQQQDKHLLRQAKIVEQQQQRTAYQHLPFDSLNNSNSPLLSNAISKSINRIRIQGSSSNNNNITRSAVEYSTINKNNTNVDCEDNVDSPPIINPITFDETDDDNNFNSSNNIAYSCNSSVTSASSVVALAEGDLRWDNAFLYNLPIITFIVGTLSSLLGIGGGELVTPLMLHLKVLPPVASATSSLMSLLNTSSNVLHHIALGDLPYDYGALVFVIGAIGGFSGRVLSLYFVAYYNRASLLVFSLVCVLAVSFVIYIYYIASGDGDVSLQAIC